MGRKNFPLLGEHGRFPFFVLYFLNTMERDEER